MSEGDPLIQRGRKRGNGRRSARPNVSQNVSYSVLGLTAVVAAVAMGLGIAAVYRQDNGFTTPNLKITNMLDLTEATVKKAEKFVYYDAAPGGDGSEASPYKTLAEAQADTTWETLYVLPGSAPLDGGITLRNNTRIVGVGPSVTSITLSTFEVVPSITNTGTTNNGGHCIVVNGDATIENIVLDSCSHSGILADNGRNVDVDHCVAFNWNTAEGIFFDPDGFDDEWGAYTAVTNTSGRTRISHCIFKDPFSSGFGIVDTPFEGAQRSLELETCDISGMFSNLAPSFYEKFAVLATANGVGTKYSVTIRNTLVHDYRPNPNYNFHKGILIGATEGARTDSLVSNTQVYRLLSETETSTSSLMLYYESRVRSSSLRSQGVGSYLTAHIEDCHLYDNVGSSQGVQAQSYDNSFLYLNASKTIFDNLSVAFLLSAGRNGTIDSTVDHNTASGDSFALQTTGLSTSYGPEASARFRARNNNFIGVRPEARFMRVRARGGSTIYNDGFVTLENNCVFVDGSLEVNETVSMQAPVYTYAQSGDNVGNVLIDAQYHNNFLNFENSLIHDVLESTVYNLENNYWGGPAPAAMILQGAPTVTLTPEADASNSRCVIASLPLHAKRNMEDDAWKRSIHPDAEHIHEMLALQPEPQLNDRQGINDQQK